eukprot:gene29711-38843_t
MHRITDDVSAAPRLSAEQRRRARRWALRVLSDLLRIRGGTSQHFNALRGGAKKRKKKTYTKPKKGTHKHKKVKLSVLKFYQVDKNGQVIKSRKDCPHETCGPGVRLAIHKDRLHCGKCSMTFLLNGDKL